MNTDQLTEPGAAFAETWQNWSDAGHRVLAIGDVPLAEKRDPVDCIARHVGEVDPCPLPRSVADPRNPMKVAAESITSDRITYADPAPAFCDPITCHFVVGGVITHAAPGT